MTTPTRAWIYVLRKFYKKYHRHDEFISASHLKGIALLKGMHYTGLLQANRRPSKPE
jgi:hypothetical protein